MSSDYYKAAFHLAKYPGSETEDALIGLVERNTLDQAEALGKRKAVDTLAQLGCVRAIKSIGNCLNSQDTYLVEHAAFALKELNCQDLALLEKITLLLDDPKQHRRALIKSISALGYLPALEKMKGFLKDPVISKDVRGASIASVSA